MANEELKNEGETTGPVADKTDETVDEEVVEEPAVPEHTVGAPPVLSPVEATSPEEEPVETKTPPVKQSKSKDGGVTLTAEAFDALMERLGKLESDSKLLNQVQDRNTIQKIERLRAEGKLIKEVKVRRIDDKYVVGWQSIQDEVYQDENGRVVEKQTTKIFFHDNTEKVYTMRQWATVGEYITFEVTGETKDADGNLFFKTVGPDGLTLQLNAIFIN
jgi:hypothetical protein